MILSLRSEIAAAMAKCASALTDHIFTTYNGANLVNHAANSNSQPHRSNLLQLDRKNLGLIRGRQH